MKKIASLLLALLMIAGLCACAPSEPEGEGYVFGFSSMDNSNPFFITIRDTMEAEIAAHGDHMLVVDAAQDQQKQNNGIESLISQGIDGIFVAPFEAAGIEPALDALNAAGIPIINFDTAVSAPDKVLTFVGSDNTNAGRVCGEDLVKRLPDGGKILIVNFTTADSCVRRRAGFLEAIDGHGFEIVGESDAHGDQAAAMAAATDLLQAHPDAVAIFAANDPMAKGCMAAAESAGLTDILIYGVDGSPDYKAELVKENTLMAGTGAQSPVTIAEKAVELMYAYLDGETPEKEYPVDTFLINAENVEQYGIDGWQ